MVSNIISQSNEYLAFLVITFIILLIIMLVVIIPVLRLGVGYLKNIFTPQSKVPEKITINTNTLISMKTYELSEKKLLNYIESQLNQGNYMYFQGMSKLFVSTRLKNKKSLIDKILKWDQVTYTIQFTSKY